MLLYSLEVPQQGILNDYPQYTFSLRNQKKGAAKYVVGCNMFCNKNDKNYHYITKIIFLIMSMKYLSVEKTGNYSPNIQ